jgi:transketolase
MSNSSSAWSAQQARNSALIDNSQYMRDEVVSQVLPFQIDIAGTDGLSDEQAAALQAIEINAARTAIKSLASLAKIGELDHLGGGLDLMSALALSLAVTDFEKVEYTIENAHCSIGYYGILSALGYLSEEKVVEEFRRGLDIPGHVSWVPGGTQLNGGRLGVMIPVAVGQALGKRGIYGDGSWVICHTGDAGWISGQALNGFNAADLTGAPVSFVMHRNGIQLSGSNKSIMDKDPRPIIEAMGVTILETTSLHDTKALYAAYREAYSLAQQGRPSLIYPTGTNNGTLADFGAQHGISSEVAEFAAEHGVSTDTTVWIPGSLMSYRDVIPMLECIFLVNELPGGEGHHDGHMKGRSEDAVLGSSMMTLNDAQQSALTSLTSQPARSVVSKARPAPGSPNLVLPASVTDAVELPDVGTKTSARAGVQVGYATVAETFPESVFVVSCDLDPSTKLGKARTFLADDHQFEVSIEEQIAAMMVNGLAMATDKPQLNIVSTFSAFYEGIAREACEMWRYQRNLNGINEGLNACYHMSHVGSCTGRDHFSGWSLDWISLAMGYLPYLHRFYAPADARGAFVAIADAAAHYGTHLVAIPRDNLPILAKQDGSGALFNPGDAWEPCTALRTHPGADKAILAMGATAFIAEEAAETLNAAGTATDVYVVNGLPFGENELEGLLAKYTGGVVSAEDGIIATPSQGTRGFASLVQSLAIGTSTPVNHVGIVDPRVAPAEGHMEVWEHFGLTAEAIVQAVQSL